MNWDAIGAFGEILGATTVLLTLLYLSGQLRQTNRISRFSTTRDLMAQFNELNRLYATDVAIREVLLKDEQLTRDEQERLYNFALMYCNAWATSQVAFDQNQIDKLILESVSDDMQASLARWGNMRAPVALWLKTYPKMAELEIFKELRKMLVSS
jgi:hypothetical protein